MLNITDNLLNSEVRDCESSEIYSLCNQRVSLPRFWQRDTRQPGNLLLVAMVVARPIFCLCFLCLDSHRATWGGIGAEGGRPRDQGTSGGVTQGLLENLTFLPQIGANLFWREERMPLTLGHCDSNITRLRMSVHVLQESLSPSFQGPLLVTNILAKRI